jgi:hypothetical protein
MTSILRQRRHLFLSAAYTDLSSPDERAAEKAPELGSGAYEEPRRTSLLAIPDRSTLISACAALLTEAQ